MVVDWLINGFPHLFVLLHALVIDDTLSLVLMIYLRSVLGYDC